MISKFFTLLRISKTLFLTQLLSNLLPYDNLEGWSGMGWGGYGREVLEGGTICHMYTSGMI